jgi:hypothetical protein
VDKPNTWGLLFGDALREATDADLALDATEFHSEYTMSGAITREMIIRAYPRVFDFEKKYGWSIWTIRAPGWLIETAIQVAAEMGDALITSSNVTYHIEKHGKYRRISNFRINGKMISSFKEYRLAVPEGLGRGSDDVSKILRKIFKPKDTGLPVWQAVENKLRQMQTLP